MNKLCRKHYNRQYYQKYKEEYRAERNEYSKQWYRDNKEHKIKYCQDNKDKITKRSSQYYKDRREYLLNQSKQWNENHKEQNAKSKKRWLQTLNGKASRKADKHNRRILEKGLTKEIIQRVYEDNIKKYGTLTCCLCFKPIEFGKDSLEHLTPLSRGGSNNYDNLGIAHLVCNIRKQTKTLEEWFNKNKYKGEKMICL